MADVVTTKGMDVATPEAMAEGGAEITGIAGIMEGVVDMEGVRSLTMIDRPWI
jgi:hypothetical protein